MIAQIKKEIQEKRFLSKTRSVLYTSHSIRLVDLFAILDKYQKYFKCMNTACQDYLKHECLKCEGKEYKNILNELKEIAEINTEKYEMSSSTYCVSFDDIHDLEQKYLKINEEDKKYVQSNNRNH